MSEHVAVQEAEHASEWAQRWVLRCVQRIVLLSSHPLVLLRVQWWVPLSAQLLVLRWTQLGR